MWEVKMELEPEAFIEGIHEVQAEFVDQMVSVTLFKTMGAVGYRTDTFTNWDLAPYTNDARGGSPPPATHRNLLSIEAITKE